MNDHISDMIARIKNAYMVGKTDLVVPHTRVCAAIAEVLLDNKYLESVAVEGKPARSLRLTLKYVGTEPALTSAKRVSKPGVRIYLKAKELKPVLSGLGLSVISTNRGIMSGRDARKNKLGGEVLMELW